MDLKKLTSRYEQFGGIQLIWQYTKLGVLSIIVKGLVRCVIKRQSFKALYPEVLRKIEPYLVNRYGPVLRSKMEGVRIKTFAHEHPKVIWWCWLQGIEAVPPIVRACYNSLVQGEWFKVNGYKVNVIDAENWKEYVELPVYIVKKWEKKQIPPALFTDLLRLQLLIKYGGSWIDSTVLCTGFNGSNVQEFKKYLDAELFLFQYTPEGSTKDINISNWFISAHSNNEVLMTLRDMLFAYWKDYNCTLDYYIFHLFFQMVAKEYQEQIVAMPYGYSMNSLVLLHHMNEFFNQKKWDKLISNVCFHKLAFRLNNEIINNKYNYYNWILNNNLKWIKTDIE